MTLMLSNEDVEKLLTIENCMDAIEYAYGELGRDQAVMGPVIRVISPVTASDAPRPGGRQLFYAYASMAAALPGWDVAANRQDSTFSITNRQRLVSASSEFQPRRARHIAASSCCTRFRPANCSR